MIFPKIHISRGITAPAQLAAQRKNLVMVGAGSGIAPFLAFLDEEQIQIEHKKTGGQFQLPTVADYDKAHLVFISRDVDQFSWISPYLDRILDGDEISSLKKLKLHVYLTLRRKVDTLASFLFWRAFTLFEMRKLGANKQLDRNTSIYKNPLTDGPVQINLGRPNFETLFNQIAAEEPTHHYVYGCAPDIITKNINNVCAKITKETGN